MKNKPTSPFRDLITEGLRNLKRHMNNLSTKGYSQSGESHWDEPTQATEICNCIDDNCNYVIDELEKFNPTDVEMYHGRTFVTENGTEYKITEDGKISGRKSIEGAEVNLVAGLPDEYRMPAQLCLSNDVPKSKLVDIVLTHGEKAKEGQALAIILSDKSTLETGRYGLIIAKIKTIK